MPSRAPLLIVRLGSALVLLAVATLYLLASIPFSYYHFLQFPHFWWMPAFIQFHPLLLAAAVAGLVLTMRDVRGPVRAWVRYLAIVGVMSAVCMGLTVVWPVLATYEVAAALCFFPIVILAAAGAIDLVAHRAQMPAAAVVDDSRRLLTTAGLAGLLSSAVYLLRAGTLGSAAQIGFQPLEILVAVAATLGGHLAVFMAAALVILVPRVAAARRGASPWLQYLGLLGGAALVAAVLIRRVLLASLILDDARAVAIAAALAVSLVLYFAACVARVTLPAGGAVVAGPAPGDAEAAGDTHWRVVVVLAAMIALCVGVISRMLVLADWGTTLQELVVCVTWMVSIALLMQIRAGRFGRLAFAVIAVMVVAGSSSAAMALRQPRAEPRSGRRPIDTALAIERYATVDTSLRVVLDLVRPMVTDTQFFNDLQRVGDATDDQSLTAVPLRVVENPGAGGAYRPNIFIVVVDSLRPDYLSAYNNDVTFTPQIGAFASDSIVMRRAFAPYTGTALSEPALWAGGLIQRRMYVQPFSAVNNLERLAVMGGYRRYLSVDEILSVILGDRSNIVRLDAHLAHPERKEEMFKFDICSTLTELAGRLDTDAASPAPIFFFSQPQSLHIRVLTGDSYPQSDMLHSGTSRFFKPAVAALGRIDTCFGQFIADLKARQMYDDSIVILTSDHGDFHGEGGQWGHAFYLAPETIRVPLIMHVPRRLLENRQWDPNAVAMLTDVTPTLYELLGYGPVSSLDVLGQPLLRTAAEPAPGAHDMYLMQSSYSRMFGLLDGDAQWLYTASANQVKEEFFDLRDGQVRTRSLGDAERLQYRKWMLERIGRVNAYYRPH